MSKQPIRRYLGMYTLNEWKIKHYHPDLSIIPYKDHFMCDFNNDATYYIYESMDTHVYLGPFNGSDAAKAWIDTKEELHHRSQEHYIQLDI